MGRDNQIRYYFCAGAYLDVVGRMYTIVLSNQTLTNTFSKLIQLIYPFNPCT